MPTISMFLIIIGYIVLGYNCYHIGYNNGHKKGELKGLIYGSTKLKMILNKIKTME